MMMFVLAAALAAQVAPAPILWEKVPAGASIADVRALFPAGERVRHKPERTTIKGHRISPECSADVHIVHRGGSVGGVVLRGEPAIFARCGAAILDILTEQHGQPLSEKTERPSILQRIRTTYSWKLGDVYLRYVRFDTEGWGGAGLGNASWEMSFSTSPEPVKL